ncbi:CD1375 family protein [Peribacillus muralis]
MAKIYYDLIKLKLRKIENVPLAWKQATQDMLDADK